MPSVTPLQIVAAVVVRDGRLLCVKRGAHKYPYLSHKWEFPGGKIERGEDAVSALVREIDEELSLPITVDYHLTTTEHSYPDFCICMSTYVCRVAVAASEPTLKEHTAMMWLQPTPLAFAGLDWAAADIPVVESVLNRFALS
jgi:8-oxo-dGTP diphosphatase